MVTISIECVSLRIGEFGNYLEKRTLSKFGQIWKLSRETIKIWTNLETHSIKIWKLPRETLSRETHSGLKFGQT